MNILTKIRQKLQKSEAFTIAETLVAVLILLMVSGIVAAGMPAAIHAYQGVELASNSELLLSTTISELRNELGVSKNVTVENTKKAVTYYNESNNMMSRIYLKDGKIMCRRNVGSDMSKEDEEQPGEPLVTDPLTVKSKLTVTYDSVDLNGSKDIVKFKNLEVKNGSHVMTSREEVYIRIIS